MVVVELHARDAVSMSLERAKTFAIRQLPNLKRAFCGEQAVFSCLDGSIVRSANNPPGVGLQASYDARVSLGHLPVDSLLALPRTDVPHLDGSVDATGDDALSVES